MTKPNAQPIKEYQVTIEYQPPAKQHTLTVKATCFENAETDAAEIVADSYSGSIGDCKTIDIKQVKRRVYAIFRTEMRDNQYVPCIVTEDEPGYHRTDWLWGEDYDHAKETAAAKNKQGGYSEKEAFDVILSSMAAGGAYQ